MSRSGRPAATRPPKAMSNMIIVTGHDSISERIIADRFALLKFDQSALSPVSVAVTFDVESFPTGVAKASAAFTMSLVPAAAPAIMTTVRPSREMVAPAWGSTTVETRASDRKSATSVAMTRCAAGSFAMARL